MGLVQGVAGTRGEGEARGVPLCTNCAGGSRGAGADSWWCPGTGQEAAELPDGPRWAGERIAIRGIAGASSG